MNKEKTIESIVEGIEKDLNGRRGYHLDVLDDDIREEIRESWRKIIKGCLDETNTD